jgi:chemotaxis protein methyltransferase CheR
MARPWTPPPDGPFRHVTFPFEAGKPRQLVNFADASEPLGPAVTASAELPGEQAAFVDWLFAQVGLDAGNYRPETLQRRLAACLRLVRARSPGEARRLLELSPRRIPDALSAMLLGVSSFFRDPVVFDRLESELAPELVRGRAGLNVWSAGCSDGAELYSLGMLFAERGWLSASYLVGTDCRPDVIAQARAGVYEPAVCRHLPPALAERYLPSEGDRRRVVAPLRRALRWRVADVLQTQEPGIWDLILCRNTTMYFRPEASAPLWPKFEALLRPGGVLVLGRAERPVGVKRLAPIGGCMFRRLRG